MVLEMILAVLLIVAIVTFPIYVLVRLQSLGRGLADLRDDLARLRRRELEALPRAAVKPPAPTPPPTPEAAALPPAPPGPPAPPPPLEKVVPPAPPLPPAPTRPAIDWESLLGANWLSKLGVIALAIAAAFFLKYAFESGWIGARARIAIGLVAASLLLALGQHLLPKPRYRSYAQVLMSGGIVIFFLSIYAAYNFYHLIGFTAAFAALALAAIAASALATANNTQAVALLCLLGAFFTPVLIHEEGVGPSDLSRLYLYLTALNIWALLLVRARPWYSLTALSFGATWLIFFGSQPGRKLDFLLFETFAALFLLFACYSGLSTLTREKEPSPSLTWIALAIILAACLAFAVVSVQILADSFLLGLPSLVMAGIFLALLLIGLAVALPSLPVHDAEVRQILIFLSADALALIVLLSIVFAPSIPRSQALPGFIFVTLTYLIFLLVALLIHRRHAQQLASTALILASTLSHAVASFHVLAPLRLWTINAAPVWLPLSGWITLLFLWLTQAQPQARPTFRKALLLAAQSLPLIALIGGLYLPHDWSIKRGLPVFSAEFLLLSGTWLASRRLARPPGLRADLLAAFTNAAAFFGLMALTAHLATYQGLVILCGCALALAVYHALIGSFALNRPDDDALHRLIYLGLAVTFLTVAIPLQLRASYLTVAWAAESAVLIWSGLAVREQRVRLYGLLLLLIAAAKALFYDLPPIEEPVRLLHNLRLLSGLSIVVAAALSAAFLSRARASLTRDEAGAAPALILLANLYALVFLSVALWQHLDAVLPFPGRGNAQQLALSIFWCIYALVLMSVGIWQRARPARLFALGLLLLSIVKVFILDLRYLEQPYRIISFLGLGLILLVVSLLYTRFEERLK